VVAGGYENKNAGEERRARVRVGGLGASEGFLIGGAVRHRGGLGHTLVGHAISGRAAQACLTGHLISVPGRVTQWAVATGQAQSICSC
jgi:hypothetical protein